MSETLTTPLAMRSAVPAPVATKFRAQAGRRVVLRLLDDEDQKIEGALRHATDDQVEFWSRVAWRHVERPRAVMVTVMLERGLWSATGTAHQAQKMGAVSVVLDHPLVPNDRRRNPRYHVSWPALLLADHRTVSGRTLDVSIGGMQIVPNPADVPAEAPIGKWMSVSLDTGRPGADPFVGLAILRAADDAAWRMEFVDLPQRMIDLLNTAIRDEVRAGASVAL